MLLSSRSPSFNTMSRILTVFSVLALNLFAIRVIALSSHVVNTRFGPVQGEYLSVLGHETSYYSSFKGIPYAKAPVGDLRFQETTFPDSWTDVLNATTAGSPCPQMSGGLSGDVSYIGDEDCLYINVFTPLMSLTDLNQYRAVIFWIHGGGFTSGSSDPDFYGPDFFIENGVVVVTFNYRLGALGFLAVNDRRANGNVGLRDQNLALGWTYDNIAKFGGDRTRITIIGQDAGAASALYHSLSQLSEGLFWSLIAMNGSPMNPWAIQTSEDALSNAYELVENLGAKANSVDDIMETLGSEDAKNIVMKTFEMSPKMFLPVRDNAETAPNGIPFLKKCIIDVWESRRFSKVPYILGFTEDPTLAYFENDVTISKLLTFAQTVANASNTQSSVPSVYNVKMGDDDWVKQAINETSDLLVKVGIEHTRRYINTYSRQSVYYYKISYVNDEHALHKFRGINENGVANGDELAYLWWIKGADMPLDSSSMISTIRSTMTRLFTNFAKHRNPTPDKLDDPVLKEKWPNYATSSRHLEFGLDEIKIDERPIVNENIDTIIENSAPYRRKRKGCTN